MDKNNIQRKKVIKTREERLKIALKSNMVKRKAQATARTSNSSNTKNIDFKLED